MFSRLAPTLWFALFAVSTCGDKDANVVRGKELTVASLPPADQAHVYEAAVQGAFDPLLGAKGAPRCKAALPEYVIRFSPVFAMRPDSVEVYLYVQKYDTPAGEASQTLRFERAYQVVRQGDDWHAVREARIPKEIRGERTR